VRGAARKGGPLPRRGRLGDTCHLYEVFIKIQ
jgi:hypothetical protein